MSLPNYRQRFGQLQAEDLSDSPPGGQSSVPYPNQTYQSRRTAGLRDLNGDGIPDYITTDSSGTWTVAMGTAVGFSTPKLIDAAFELSVETVGCFSDNPTAGTVFGLYEMDGDGVPELVTLSNRAYNLKDRACAPERRHLCAGDVRPAPYDRQWLWCSHHHQRLLGEKGRQHRSFSALSQMWSVRFVQSLQRSISFARVDAIRLWKC